MLNYVRSLVFLQTIMAVWLEKLIFQGVLMVREYEIMFLYHPGCLHQEISNHQGLDVMHFEYFRMVIPLAAQYDDFPFPRVCP